MISGRRLYERPQTFEVICAREVRRQVDRGEWRLAVVQSKPLVVTLKFNPSAGVGAPLYYLLDEGPPSVYSLLDVPLKETSP